MANPLGRIGRVAVVHDSESANAHLAEGWELVSVFLGGEGDTLVYVLGRGHTTGARRVPS